MWFATVSLLVPGSTLVDFQSNCTGVTGPLAYRIFSIFWPKWTKKEVSWTRRKQRNKRKQRKQLRSNLQPEESSLKFGGSLWSMPFVLCDSSQQVWGMKSLRWKLLPWFLERLETDASWIHQLPVWKVWCADRIVSQKKRPWLTKRWSSANCTLGVERPITSWDTCCGFKGFFKLIPICLDIFEMFLYPIDQQIGSTNQAMVSVEMNSRFPSWCNCPLESKSRLNLRTSCCGQLQ